MKPVVILWIVVLSILLLLALSKKNPVSQARATVVETDCLNVATNAHPCTVSVKYEINGASYTQKMGVKPSADALIGKQMTIGYHPRFPLQIQEYKSHTNPFVIPLLAWFFLGLALLYFAYDPIRIRAASAPSALETISL